MSTTEPLVLGNDASWKGWGQCLANADGPLWADHVAIGRGRAWRMMHLRLALDVLDNRLDGLGPVRVVVEKPPMKMAGKAGRNRGATLYGSGKIIGPIMCWGTRPGWPFPWEIDIKQEFDRRTRRPKGDLGWRDFWNIGKQPSREAYKIAAITVVERRGWGHLLEPYGWRKGLGLQALLALGEGPCGDVAEAILIAVGCAMRPELAPKGPRSGVR